MIKNYKNCEYSTSSKSKTGNDRISFSFYGGS